MPLPVTVQRVVVFIALHERALMRSFVAHFRLWREAGGHPVGVLTRQDVLGFLATRSPR